MWPRVSPFEIGSRNGGAAGSATPGLDPARAVAAAAGAVLASAAVVIVSAAVVIASVAVASAADAPASASPGAPDDEPDLSLDGPGGAWSLSIALPGFEIGPHRDTNRGVSRLAANVDTGMLVTAAIERVEGADDAPSCRTRDRKRLKTEHDSLARVRDRERGPAAIREFRVRERRGVPVEQKHVVAYVYHDGACAIVHITKAGYVPDDDELFDAVLDAIRLTPH